VVTEINRNLAETLKLCGPAILTHDNTLQQVTTIISAIITRQHPCQMDLGDDEDQDMIGETSEYDWLVVDTALDVVVGLSTALGPQFGEIWKMYEKSIIKMASSPVADERSTATGAIGECIAAGMGEGVTPYTEKLLKVLLHRLSDEDPDTKSNAAYGTGLLITHSTNSAAYLPSYNQILSKLEPLLSIEQSTDNAAGCVSRMIMAHPERVPISEVMPALVKLLPLKKDYLENKPIYECIVGLCMYSSFLLLSAFCNPH
jgi:importin-4